MARRRAKVAAAAGSDAPGLEALIDYLRRNRGIDLSGYKRTTLARRVTRRMQTVKADTFGDYLDYLEVHPDEFGVLFDTVLIKVTSFFRDPEAWDKLRRDVLPAIVKSKGAAEPIRVWSAGCSSGEEAYTLAIVWAEALGVEQFRARVKIYASDVDAASALGLARQATYAPKDLEVVPEGLRRRYFERSDSGYAFNSELRRSIIFGRHDLLHDAPISRLDLLVCRNTLMYFNAEAQARILARFHFALNEHGFLFLGKAEMLLTHANLFQPIDLRYRIFTKAREVNLRDRLFVLAQTGDHEAGSRLSRHIRLREEAFNLLPTAQIAVDAEGTLVLANEMARSMFGLAGKDLGRRFQDLQLSYQPLELRSLIEKVRTDRKPLRQPDVVRTLPSGEVQYLDVHVLPLWDNGGNVFMGTSVLFYDVTEAHKMRMEVQRSSQDLETAYEEIQSTNEELETTNEELQSTVEELQTTNEELQATNEEHETMNEELQATNEELQTVNDELRGRTEDLNHANAFLTSIVSSLQAGVAVIDRNLNVTMWNSRAENLWGVRSEEVRGQSLLKLDIGLPAVSLVEPLRACLAGSPTDSFVVAATDRRGRPIKCRVTCTPLVAPGDSTPIGVIVMMDQVSG